MKPINIYALTRLSEPSRLTRLERQMSKRDKNLKIKAWELEGLRALIEKLDAVTDHAAELYFYYSFIMPKLGKEFDLLRVSDQVVVNIELKSGNVSDEVIHKQLLQNRYYLATLGRTMYFYTYVSGTDRLVRLTGSGRLIEADWRELAEILERQGTCYNGNVEELFKEERYLFSPLTEPDKFLRQEYFLTSQQKDIKRQILRNIKQAQEEQTKMPVQGFTGFPGTGKTILLYDIAMHLSRRDQVCVLHLGARTRELEQLDERLKRIDFLYVENRENLMLQGDYCAVLVDEGHRMDRAMLEVVLEFAGKRNAPVIISYDREDVIFREERNLYGADLIESLPDCVRYRLTNRIRLNRELSSFIRCVMCCQGVNHRGEYPSVALTYARNDAEAKRLRHTFEKDEYVYIRDKDIDPGSGNGIEVSKATCREYERVVMLIDASFAYDEQGYIRYAKREESGGQDSRVRNLFRGLSRAKENIAIVVVQNEAVFDKLLSIVQRERHTTTL